MNKSVEIILTSPDNTFPTLSPTGVQISYGLGEIPTALLNLSPAALELFCDFERFRRSRVKLLVRTVNGCLNFDGVVDGLSMNQSVGGISVQLVIKSQWQVLKEVNTKCPGLTAASVDIFSQVGVVNLSSDAVGGALNGGMELYNLTSIPNDLPIIQWIVRMMQAVVSGQRFEHFQKQVTEPNWVTPLAVVAQSISDTNLPWAEEKLSNVITEYVDNWDVKASNSVLYSEMFAKLVEARSNLFDLFLSMLAAFECTLVIGNQYAYVVPNIGFLKMPHYVPAFRQISTIPNVVFPAQYNSFSFSDNGYVDVKAVAMIADPTSLTITATGNSEVGYFIDPSARGGVLVDQLPTFAGVGGLFSYFQTQTDVRKGVASGAPNTFVGSSSPPSYEQGKKEGEDMITAALGVSEADRQYLFDQVFAACNEWAELKYYQVKYTDRVGSFTTLFNPNFAPGAVGQLYTRFPGTHIDFFVTGVTHSLSLAPDTQGEAITTVSFNSGRIGASALSTGVDKISFFNFNSDTSFIYARNFVNDVSGV